MRGAAARLASACVRESSAPDAASRAVSCVLCAATMRRRKRLVTPTAPADVMPTNVFGSGPGTYRMRTLRLTPLLERLRALAVLQNMRLRVHQHTRKMEIRFMTELAQKYGLMSLDTPPPTLHFPASSAASWQDEDAMAVRGQVLPSWMSLGFLLTVAVAINALIMLCLRRSCFMKREKPVTVVPTDPPEVETIVLQILDDSEDLPSPIEEYDAPPRSPSADSRDDSAILAAASDAFGSFGPCMADESPLSPSLLRAFPPPYEDDPPPPYNAFVQYKPDSAPQTPLRPPDYTPRAASPLSSASEISYSAVSASGTPWPPPDDIIAVPPRSAAGTPRPPPDDIMAEPSRSAAGTPWPPPDDVTAEPPRSAAGTPRPPPDDIMAEPSRSAAGTPWPPPDDVTAEPPRSAAGIPWPPPDDVIAEPPRSAAGTPRQPPNDTLTEPPMSPAMSPAKSPTIHRITSV